MSMSTRVWPRAVPVNATGAEDHQPGVHMSPIRGFRAVVPIVLAAVAVLAACGSAAPKRDADMRTYCLKSASGRTTLCTPDPVPSAVVEADAKRFDPVPGRLTVYVVRGQWSDALRAVEFEVDGSIRVTTLPRSLVRLRLDPGAHVISLSAGGKTQQVTVEGGSGEVLFVELAGSGWPWNRPYHLSLADPAGTRERALKTRLVADLDGGSL